MIVLSLFFSLFCLATAQNSSAPGVSDDQRLTAMKNRDNLRRAGRYTLFSSGFSLQPAPTRFCGASDDDAECNWPVYVESALLVGALAMVVAGAALLFGILFWTLRCCGCCGGLKRSHGWCCPGAERTEPYSPRQVNLVRFGLIALAFILFVSFLIMQIGSQSLSNGLELYVDTTVLRATDLSGDLDDAVTAVDGLAAQAATYNFSLAGVTAPLRDAVNQTKTVVAKFQSVGNTIKDVDSQRAGVQLATGLVSLALVAVASLGGCCNLPVLAKVLAVVGFAAFALAWVAFALNYSVAVVLADFCTELESPQPVFTNPAIAIYANCSSLGLAALKTALDTQLNRTAVGMCAGVARACDANQTQPCAFDYAARCATVRCARPANECTRATLPQYSGSTVNDAVFGCVANGTTAAPAMGCPAAAPSSCASGFMPGICGSTNRTLTECASTCDNAPLRNVSASVVGGIAFLNNVELVIARTALVLSCDRIKVVVDEAKDFACVTALSAFYSVAAGSALTGCFMLAAIIMGVLGSKRFTKELRERFNEVRTATMNRYATLRGRPVTGGKSAKDRAREERSRRMSYAAQTDMSRMQSEF